MKDETENHQILFSKEDVDVKAIKKEEAKLAKFWLHVISVHLHSLFWALKEYNKDFVSSEVAYILLCRLKQ